MEVLLSILFFIGMFSLICIFIVYAFYAVGLVLSEVFNANFYNIADWIKEKYDIIHTKFSSRR